MATYFTDFSEYTVGSLPTDWTETWASAGNWTVESNAAAEGNVAFRSNGDTSQREAVYWDTVGTGTDLEIYAKGELRGGNASNYFRLILRGSESTTQHGYLTQLQAFEDQFALAKYDTTGSYVTLDTAAITAGVADGDVFEQRLRVNGSDLMAKVWPAGTTEPSAWTCTAIDADFTSGWVGLGVFAEFSDTDFYTVGVGTVGDTAPTAGAGVETTTISGTVTLNGSAVEGAKVTGLNTTEGTVQSTALTDAAGTYSLTYPVGVTAHIMIEYESPDGTKYNDASKPFIVTA